MIKNSKDDYIVLFKGVKLSRREANKVGFSLILGFAGAILSVLSLGPENKLLSLIICAVLAAIGYFWLGKKIFKT